LKQRITIDQLQKLTPELREKLRDWWKPQTGDWAIISNETFGLEEKVLVTSWNIEYGIANLNFIKKKGFSSLSKDSLLPLLSIGQMLELIDELDPGKLIVLYENLYMSLIMHSKTSENYLCDILWRTIKKIL
jgi:hypothetical protein